MNLGHRVGTWVRVATCPRSQTQSKLVRCGRTQFALEPATTGGGVSLPSDRSAFCLSICRHHWLAGVERLWAQDISRPQSPLIGWRPCSPLTFLRSPAGPGRCRSVTACLGSAAHSSVARCGVVPALVSILATALRPRWPRRRTVGAGLRVPAARPRVHHGVVVRVGGGHGARRVHRRRAVVVVAVVGLAVQRVPAGQGGARVSLRGNVTDVSASLTASVVVTLRVSVSLNLWILLPEQRNFRG